MLPYKVDIIVENTAEIDKVVRIYSINSVIYFFLYNSAVLLNIEIENIRNVLTSAVFKLKWSDENIPIVWSNAPSS